MIVMLKPGVTQAEEEKIKATLAPCVSHKIVGESVTVLAVTGDTGAVDKDAITLLSGVERVVRVSTPYKLVSRQYKSEDTVVEVGGVKIGGSRITIIAGPCAVESYEQMTQAAKIVREAGGAILRGGAYKPRTSPYSFQGLGEEGLKILREAGDKYALPVVTECVSSETLPIVAKYVDMIQIGARNMHNFELLKAAGSVGLPVLLKRGLCATIEEWLLAAEYLMSEGAKVVLCERGIRTYERATRNTLDLSCVPILHSLTHLPVLVDPSHATGKRELVIPMARAAISAGAQGLEIEVHPNPQKALSDGSQSLYPPQLYKLVRDIKTLSIVVQKEVTGALPLSRAEDGCGSCLGDKDKKTIAFCGARGAWSEIAAKSYAEELGADIKTAEKGSFREVFESVCKEGLGCVPIENSIAGSVYENYDLFTQFSDVSIIASLVLRIKHALLAPRGTKIEDIKEVLSHPQALAQCQRFILEHKWQERATVSTATAAEEVAKMASEGKGGVAAIAAGVNAKIYGLEVLQDGIEDDTRNFTRFAIISCSPPLSAGNTASIIFCTEDRAGSLLKALECFAKNGINLSRLESRPVSGEPWKYYFYARGRLPDGVQCLSKGIQELKNSCQEVRLLGIYDALSW